MQPEPLADDWLHLKHSRRPKGETGAQFHSRRTGRTPVRLTGSRVISDPDAGIKYFNRSSRGTCEKKERKRKHRDMIAGSRQRETESCFRNQDSDRWYKTSSLTFFLVHFTLVLFRSPLSPRLRVSGFLSQRFIFHLAADTDAKISLQTVKSSVFTVRGSKREGELREEDVEPVFASLRLHHFLPLFHDFTLFLFFLFISFLCPLSFSP